ncbi:MAG: hypothetical protein EPO26_18560 [Chloroflexota bacterium]|nr:MAG: hypothetical protein EPO26_18560 [Chloroflexota bacterium]
MADLYLDSDVSVRVAPLLRAAGHDAVTAAEQGRRRATDDEQLLAATQQGRTVVSHNRKDFVLLHDAWRRWSSAYGLALPPHPGILILDQLGDHAVADAVTRFVTADSVAPLANSLYWWRASGGWRHQLPDRRWVPYPGR